MSQPNQYSTENKQAIAGHLFQYCTTIDSAITAGEISRATGVPISTVHRFLMPHMRAVGIVESNEKQQGNTKPAKRYWYNVNLVHEATAEYAAKRFPQPQTNEEVQMPIPNNATNLDVRDLARSIGWSKSDINVLEEGIAAYTYKDWEDFIDSIQVAMKEVEKVIDNSEMEEERKRKNFLLRFMAITQ